MKIFISLLLFCSLQGMLESARTFDDISADFKNYIASIDGMFDKETHFMIAEEDGKEKLAEFQGRVFGMLIEISRELVALDDGVREQVEQIIKETGLSSHEELIAHCLESEETAFHDVLLTANDGMMTCAQIEVVYTAELNSILAQIKHKYSGEISALDTVIPNCIPASETNSQFVSCLVSNLYVKLVPTVGQALTQMRDDIAGMNGTMWHKLDVIQTCYDDVSIDTQKNTGPVLVAFKDCCVEASQNDH